MSWGYKIRRLRGEAMRALMMIFFRAAPLVCGCSRREPYRDTGGGVRCRRCGGMIPVRVGG